MLPSACFLTPLATRLRAAAHFPEPPRSHYDSVTERLTLNMDHFCPWVVNTVGFYNRKFFMLFLCYANLTMFVALIFLLTQAPRLWPWLTDEESGAPSRYFPGMINMLVYGAAIAIDGSLLICVLGPFMVFHLRMAARNETTIEGSTHPDFDVGTMQNLRSVFGRKVWAWPIPLYLQGPDGDGVHWPRKGDQARVGTRTSVTPTASAALPAP